jgi:hypothetical protein
MIIDLTGAPLWLFAVGGGLVAVLGSIPGALLYFLFRAVAVG